jgi:hypothetical protein
MKLIFRCLSWAILLMPLLAQEDWWSTRALIRPDVPEGVAGNVVDRFIQAKQADRQLTGAKEAERRMLARRLSFDLCGIPLETSRVEAFVKDEREDAYEKLLDELLASPRYGERWGRHWLDAVHFGETHGYDKDQPRENAWRYRDYVIRSLNMDKPYERFVREQLAGDVLWPQTEDGIVALGFLSAGPWDLIGHMEVPEEKIDGKVARHLDRDDMVAATMNVFCSLTVQCAQCHDHKVDPVTIEDYYSLQSVFGALDRADREYDLDRGVGLERSRLNNDLRLANEKVRALGGPGEGLGYHSQVAKRQDIEKWVQVDLGKVVPIEKVTLIGAREYGFDDFGFPHRFKVEVSESENFLERVVLRDETGGDFLRPGMERVVVQAGGSRGRYVRVVATKLWNRRRAGQELSGDWIFALGGFEVEAAGMVMPVVDVTAFDSIEAMPRWGKAHLVEKRSAARESIEREVKRIEEQLRSLPQARVAYVATVHQGSGNFVGRGAFGGKPREVKVLDRGDVTRPLSVAQPGAVPGIVGEGGIFELPENHSEGERRVALADWVAHRDNRLTWRSIVNRVWQGHFGTGLVDTANDFGRLGGKPSHPELLDWLAVEFRDGGGSLKNLHRLIVSSAVYKQESQGDSVNELRDGSNRFLWRQNRRRLEAEAIRDTVLIVAGKMNWEMGGPSFKDFVIEKPEHSPHYLYEKANPNDKATHRRSVYRFVVRSQPQPFMEALDCADPSLLVDKRGETTTALQALAMMNSPFVVKMAEHFARRIEESEDVVGTAIELSLGRVATSEEMDVLGKYAKTHGVTAMCRVIFNLSEFGYVD